VTDASGARTALTPTDWIALAGDVFTGIAMVAALVAVYFAWKAIHESRESTKVLEHISFDMNQSAMTLTEVVGTTRDVAEGLTASLTLTERLRAEDRELHRLARLERVMTAIHRMIEGARLYHTGNPAVIHAQQIELRTALSVIPRDDLPRCREAAGALIPSHSAGSIGTVESSLPDALLELNSAIDEVMARINTLQR
jgi:hypothetical protein